jgi:quercetin dioxygenase-like cupin family protein
MALLRHFPPSRIYGTAYVPSEDEMTKPTSVKVELARGDLTGRQMDIIVNIFEVPPGATVARHIHPGEEVVYVLEGGTLEQPDGKLLTLETGTAIIYARDIPHAGAKNVSEKPLKMFNVFVVDKGKPMMVFV